MTPDIFMMVLFAGLMHALWNALVKGASDRTITFEAIATASNLPVDQVELLVMRALSLKLIRGLLDQVGSLHHHHHALPLVSHLCSR